MEKVGLIRVAKFLLLLIGCHQYIDTSDDACRDSFIATIRNCHYQGWGVGVLIGMVTEYLLAYGDERRYRCHLRQRASPSVAAGQTFNQRPTNQQGKTLKKSLANVITM